MSYEARFNKNGNIKIGNSIWSWNKLAGSGKINGCKGSCGKHCKGCYNVEDPKHSPCYVFNAYLRYGWEHASVVKGHIRNTNALRDNMTKSFEELDIQLTRAHKKPTAVRIHSSGEIESTKELKEWMNLASKHSEVPFYIYTKNYSALDKVLASTQIPSNFYINVSIWHKVGINCYNRWKHLDNIRAFVYDDGYKYPEELKFDCHCPAYDSKGKMNHNFTCDKCKICYKKDNKVCACYDH